MLLLRQWIVTWWSSCAIFLFLFTWLAFIIGEACLLAGTVQNPYHTRYRTLFFLNPQNCQTLRKSKDPNYRRMVITCFIQAVYLLELDRQEQKDEIMASLQNGINPSSTE